MNKVPIYYSIREENNKSKVRFFSDKACVDVDQELYKGTGTGSFIVEVNSGSVYIDAVMSKEEYINFLEQAELANALDFNQKSKVEKLRRAIDKLYE